MNAEPILEAETSISQLITDKDSTQNGVIIDEILQEINKNGSIEPGEPPNITMTEEIPQMQQQPTQMQQQQQQPTQMQQQQQQQQPIQMQQQQQQQDPIPGPMLGQQQQQGAPVDFQNQEQIIFPQETNGLMDNIDSTEKTFENLKDNILDELKMPAIVLVLFIILGSGRIDSIFINTHTSFFVDAAGKITFPSLFIKSIIAALLFYIIKIFL
jgi:FtsZ-interacting cell division protein ZipA